MKREPSMTETETTDLEKSLISLADIASSADLLVIIKTEAKV